MKKALYDTYKDTSESISSIPAGICVSLLRSFCTFSFLKRNTSMLGAEFLRIACLALPLSSVNYLISYILQARGKGIHSAILTSCRQGLCNIPLLIIMNAVFEMFGMMWTQMTVEIIMLPVSLGMYFGMFRRLTGESRSRLS